MNLEEITKLLDLMQFDYNITHTYGSNYVTISVIPKTVSIKSTA